jgi:hypothetical protein
MKIEVFIGAISIGAYLYRGLSLSGVISIGAYLYRGLPLSGLTFIGAYLYRGLSLSGLIFIGAYLYRGLPIGRTLFGTRGYNYGLLYAGASRAVRTGTRQANACNEKRIENRELSEPSKGETIRIQNLTRQRF